MALFLMVLMYDSFYLSKLIEEFLRCVFGLGLEWGVGETKGGDLDSMECRLRE